MKLTTSIVLSCILLMTEVDGQTLDTVILHSIVKRSKEAKSDALLIMKDGKILIHDFNGKKEEPIYLASAGKSLTALGVAKLVDLGLINSLDELVCTIYPEWRQGKKKDVTIRMLLNHTSGLQNNPNASIELEPPPNSKVKDIIKLALSAEIASTPGTVSSYNNKAVALLGGIIEVASGKRMDKFFEEHFYKPMNITSYDWIKDEVGHPTAHGAFILKPTDLAKFGTLMLNQGTYNNKRILSKKSVEECLRQSFFKEPIFGLLWWRIPKWQVRVIDNEIIAEWKANGVSDSLVKKATPMLNKKFSDRDSFYNDFFKVYGENGIQLFPQNVRISKKVFSDEIIAYYADGFRGNYLVVIPSLRLVAVRCAKYRDDFDYGKDDFGDFPQMVSKLLSN